MRILFSSGAWAGGAARSTMELADALSRRGHDTSVLIARPPARNSPYDLGLRASMKWEGHPGWKVGRRLLRTGGRRAIESSITPSGTQRRMVPVPENAYLEDLHEHRPDVVVLNSLPRLAARWMQADLRARSIPYALYVRELTALGHFTISHLRPDLTLANAEYLASEVESYGERCLFVPSAIDCTNATVDSTRTCVLLVNPDAANHLDLVAEMARARPEIPFVLQESWAIGEAERSELLDGVARLANVELRPRSSDPSEVYRDARVLLATYPSGRPRVVVEAQHNGIPCIGLDQPGLAEVVGGAGILVDAAEGVGAWLAALDSVWSDPTVYESLERACRRRAAETPTEPARVAAVVERALEGIVTRADA